MNCHIQIRFSTPLLRNMESKTHPTPIAVKEEKFIPTPADGQVTPQPPQRGEGQADEPRRGPAYRRRWSWQDRTEGERYWCARYWEEHNRAEYDNARAESLKDSLRQIAEQRNELLAKVVRLEEKIKRAARRAE